MRVQKEFRIKSTLVLTILPILLCACTGKKGQEDALTAHNTVERVREEWSR